MEIHNPLTSNRCHIQLEIKTLFKNTANNKKKKNKLVPIVR